VSRTDGAKADICMSPRDATTTDGMRTIVTDPDNAI
jgi:hypothetical protein